MGLPPQYGPLVRGLCRNCQIRGVSLVLAEFSPTVVIEAKLTEDDGTARDKVTRVQRLRPLRDERGQHYDVVACIAGRGFKVRRNDMRRLLVATNGMVFTLASIEHLVAHTRIRDFVTRPLPGGPQ